MSKECNPSPNQRAVLAQINAFDVHQINDFLKRGFSLKCLLHYDISPEKLNKLDSSMIIQKINDEELSEQELREAGLNETLISKVFETDPGPGPGPGPIPVPPPGNPMLDRIREGKENVAYIKDALFEGSISDYDLSAHCYLSDEMIQRIRSYRMEQMDAIDIDQLPALKPDRTDFYFLGMAGAGKSCLLASLLAYWHSKGVAHIAVDNPRSVQYMRILGGGFAQGMLPVGNPNAFIDYIDLTLQVKEEQKGWFGKGVKQYDIPINLIDMAGEKFAKVADQGKEEFDKHLNYFKNNNLKALFFVIDYTTDDNNENAFEQSFALQVVLQNLEDMGIMEDTTGLYIIVTKADRFGVAEDQYGSFAKEYVQEHYANFLNAVDNLERKYDLGVEILAYSIGDCMFGQLITDFNPRTNNNLRFYPEILHKRILEHTARFKRGIGGFLSN